MAGGNPYMQANATLNTTKHSNKGSQRRVRFLLVLLLFFMAWAGVTIWDQFGKLHAKSSVVKDLELQLADAKKLNEDTQREVARLHDKEYIEQKIRKELHYVKPGDTIFYTPKVNP
jgi:cell division protein DivIC